LNNALGIAMRNYEESFSYWEGVAQTRWGSYISNIEKQAILKAEELAGNPARALEIGCESGRWSELLSDLGWNMICADINTENLELCRKRIPSAQCILVGQQDTTLPAGPSSVSLLLCIEVFPVIDSEWFLPEANRVLANGGVLIGVLLNTLSIRGLFYRAAEPLRKNDPENNFYRQPYFSFRNKISSIGFDIIYQRGFCWFPFSRTSNSKMIPIAGRIEKFLYLDRLIQLSPWVVFIARKSISK